MDMDTSLPENYTYNYIKKEAEKECIFRIKEVTNEDEAFNWLQKFSVSTKSTWRKARTYPKTGRNNNFKVDMRCVHSTDRRVTGLRPSKHTGCSATLQIIIKRFSEAHLDDLNRHWPTVITIRGMHNHGINTAEVLKYRDISESSLTKLKELFRKGHTASSALETLKTELLFQHGDEYYEIAADGYHVPSYSKVHKLFEKEFVSEYGPFIDNDFGYLKEQLDIYTSTSEGTAKFYKTSNSEHYFVVICSPIMKRVHQMIPQTSELVLVDASGGMDKQRHRIYAFVTPTAAGGLPLGIIISDSEKECVFRESLSKLKDIFPDDSFYGQKEPKVFITDNDLKERGPLKEHFPNATLLLCQFHFLKALWSWLCASKHKIDASDRQEIYNNVKAVLYAQTEENAETYHLKIITSEMIKKYSNFLSHYLNLWKCRYEWASCFRQNLLLRGSNTTNYVEIVFRILKDCIFDRVMAFNLSQFVDYILTRYEIYLEKRLIDFSNGRCPKAVLKHFLPPVSHNLYSFQKNENGIFNVKNISTNTQYNVDIVNGMCSCMMGLSGKLCKHSSFVITSIGSDIETTFNLATKKTKEIMLYVATGQKAPLNWHEPLKFNHTTPNNENVMSHTSANEPSNVSHFYDHQVSSNVPQSSIQSFSAVEKEELNNLMKRMMSGIETAPEIFVPAAKKMLENSKKFASTEVGLVTAMHTFGTYNGVLAKNCAKKLSKRSRAIRIGVQPTAIGRRKKCLSGKKKLCVGRERGHAKVVPQIKCHDYTTFGSLPSRKRKAPHNLTDCVYSNKGLGAKK